MTSQGMFSVAAPKLSRPSLKYRCYTDIYLFIIYIILYCIVLYCIVLYHIHKCIKCTVQSEEHPIAELIGLFHHHLGYRYFRIAFFFFALLHHLDILIITILFAAIRSGRRRR
jgi:hypothetical protein